jgi:hypothetical protein
MKVVMVIARYKMDNFDIGKFMIWTFSL